MTGIHTNLVAVVMCGGSGRRLWPLSTTAKPKQFLNLVGERSLYEQTLDRLADSSVRNVISVCGKKHAHFILGQNIDRRLHHSIIFEEYPRNTAAAIALAALSLEQPALLLIMPSDQYILDVGAFFSTIQSAIPYAEKGDLCLFGVLPTGAREEYGYIKAEGLSGPRRRIVEFVEKPNKETANFLLEGGNCYWNSGNFLCRSDKILDELESFEPEILASCSSAIKAAKLRGANLVPDPGFLKQCPTISFDKAVVERTPDSVVFPLTSTWRDLGSWESLVGSRDKDENGNIILGDCLVEDAYNSVILSTGRKLVVKNVSDICVISSPEATTVTNRDELAEFSYLTEQSAQVDKRINESTNIFKLAPGSSLEFEASSTSFSRFTVLEGSILCRRERTERIFSTDADVEIYPGESVSFENIYDVEAKIGQAVNIDWL